MMPNTKGVRATLSKVIFILVLVSSVRESSVARRFVGEIELQANGSGVPSERPKAGMRFSHYLPRSRPHGCWHGPARYPGGCEEAHL